MEALIVSTGIVAHAEIGDKTQLLSFILAAKFRKPLPITLATLVATIANHGFAAAIGAWITSMLGPQVLRWVLRISFLAMAGWALIRDKFHEDDAKLANVPAVYLDGRIADRFPVRLVHVIAAVLFAILGIGTLLGAGAGIGL
jgi:Ca2+/H+ antiporter, TMEM165/GDT1 family